MTNILLVGGGRGGLAMLNLFKSLTEITVIGIVDVKTDAQAILEAHQLKIATYTNFGRAVQLPGLNIVFDTTGSKEAEEIILANLPADVAFVNSVVRKFWSKYRNISGSRSMICVPT